MSAAESARETIAGYIARDEWDTAPGLIHVNPRDMKLFTADSWESVARGVSGKFRRVRFWRTGIVGPHGGRISLPVIPDRRVPVGVASFRHAGEKG